MFRFNLFKVLVAKSPKKNIITTLNKIQKKNKNYNKY